MDFAMPYEDYVKFWDVAKEELSEKYSIINLHGSHLVMLNDDAEYYFNKYHCGMVELCPVFGLPKSKILQQYLSIKSHFLNRFNEKFSHPYDKRGWKGKIVQVYINYLLRKRKPYDYFGAKRNNMFKKYSYYKNQSDKIIFAWRLRPNKKLYTYKQIFYYEDFKSTLEVPFEDTTMSVPVGYDRYLTMDFGDYMTLPPENKRFRSGNRLGFD